MWIHINLGEEKPYLCMYMTWYISSMFAVVQSERKIKTCMASTYVQQRFCENFYPLEVDFLPKSVAEMRLQRT